MNTGDKVRHIFREKLGIVNAINSDGSFEVNFGNGNEKTSSKYLEPESRTKYFYSDTGKISEKEVKKEIKDYIVQEGQNWFAVDDMVIKATNHFIKYRDINGKPLNQGGFDPLFVITKSHPGEFIKKELLIFRKATGERKINGAKYEFKVREASTQEEILESLEFAKSKNKYVYLGNENAS